eukprot:INCI5525.1.p1 GENE.INCI5525.1~~INCI5525.1.p1  ORF type:complete len:298 (+),score=65.39 INCI5525.1:394-1287(+)
MAGCSSGESVFVDYYAVLSIDLTASVGDVRKAFLRKALETHPDKNLDLDPKVAEANFVLVQKANEVLGNVAAREAYNVSYFRWLRGQKSHPGAKTDSRSTAPFPRTPKRRSSPSPESSGTKPQTAESGDAHQSDQKRSRSSTRSHATDNSSKQRDSHDWDRYRDDASRSATAREQSVKQAAARRARQERERRQRVAAAQDAVQQLYEDRSGSSIGRTIKLEWQFPHERPRTTKKIRRFVQALLDGRRHDGGVSTFRIRLVRQQAATVELSSSVQAEKFIAIVESKHSHVVNATWALG